MAQFEELLEKNISFKDRDGAKINVQDLLEIVTQFKNCCSFLLIVESEENQPAYEPVSVKRSRAYIGAELLIESVVSSISSFYKKCISKFFSVSILEFEKLLGKTRLHRHYN